MRIEVYDADDPKCIDDLKKQDFIGSVNFTLAQIVTTATGEYTTQLEGKKPKKDTKIKITAEEKKANYGSTMASFGIDYHYSNKSATLFVVIDKIKANGKTQPVFKTDCKKCIRGKYEFNGIQIDTDTLFDDDEEQDCLVQVYQYKVNGYHVKICSGNINYRTIKNLRGQ